ncbi:hypothetical protein CK203_105656 [Vitis vinifera]|uniref:CCHC-type domain-containing protein n=1 Tax=Vitis vinifera TaxID=29760 RepID=A0A438CH52_VITVI|nr:hypothetical protein CK203_105656 [Vitis vinifera]
MPPRRLASSQNSQANNDVPPPIEGLPPMNAEALYRYLETLVGLVERQASAMRLNLLDNPHLLWVAHLMTLRKEEKALKCQDGLKPYLKNKISILKLSVYSEVVDRALIAKKDNKELQQYREQQRKRRMSDSAHDNQTPKRFVSTEKFGACGHMIRDCPENKKFIIGKPKEENKENKQKPRVQGLIFAMTHQDAQATSDLVTVGMLGMLVSILNFDLTVDFPMGHSIMENIMFRGYLMMTSYMEMLVNLVLLDH